MPSLDARDLPALLVFLEVVRAGSLTRAAQRLHTVQSNVTARIKSLEDAVGVPLLARHARGVRLTPAGELALVLAQRADAVLDDLRFAFGKGVQGAAKLRVGAIETIAATHLPAKVAAFGRRHPSVDISVQTGSSAALVQHLQQGELDVAFVSRPPRLTGFRQQVAFRDRLVVVMPRAMPPLPRLLAAAGPPVKVLVQRPGCSYTERLLTHLERALPRPCPYRLLELGTLEGIARFVQAGVGIAAMPRAFATSVGRDRAIRLSALPGELSRLETYLVARAGPDASRSTNAFVSLFGGTFAGKV